MADSESTCTVREAAEILGCSQDLIRSLYRQNHIKIKRLNPFSAQSQSRVLIPISEIKRLIKQQSSDAPSSALERLREHLAG